MSSDTDFLPQLIHEIGQADPERIFLQDVDGPVRTYAEVYENSLRWAQVLEAQGVSRGTPVLSMLPVCFDAVELWLGVIALGAILIPLNTVYRGGVLENAVLVSGSHLMVTRSESLEVLRSSPKVSEQLTTLIVIDLDTAFRDDRPTVLGLSQLWPTGSIKEVERAAPRGSEIAVVVFTSGTTGHSKGVVVHWAQLHFSSRHYFPAAKLGPKDRYYSPYPLFHLSGIYAVYCMALAGGSVVMRDRFSTGSFWSDINKFECTTTLLLGAMVDFLVSQPPSPADQSTPLDKIAMVPLHANVEDFKRRFGVNVCTSFGSTEVGNPIGTDGFTLIDNRSCGRVRDAYECRLVDSDDIEVPVGQVGELIVRAKAPWTTMGGYWNQPEATVEATRNQWIHTGDLLYRDEAGNYYFVDRSSDSLRRRGENISSFEVEIAIGTHPEVRECAVVGVPSEFSEDEVFAVVVRADDSALTEVELYKFLRPLLPSFSLPRYIEFVTSVPKTASQKIEKGKLKSRGISADTWDQTKSR